MSRQNICGIYKIFNKVNGKQYIGSSKSVYYRWAQNHLHTLRKGIHDNRHLQSAWKKYGEAAFEFKVIEECKKNELLEREGFWIEKERSWEREYGYNLVRIVDGKQVCADEPINKRLNTMSIADYWTTGINGEVVKLFNEGMSKNAIAIKLGITRSAVYSCLEQNGLYKKTGNGTVVKLTPKVKQQIRTLRKSGKTWREILETTGISKTQAHRAKVMVPDGKYFGNKRSSYRTLTPQVRKKATKLRSQGKTWREIGELLGVSRQVFYWNGLAKEQTEMVRKKVTPKMIEMAAVLRNAGLTWKDIEEKIGCSGNAFRRYIKS
jgi:DNA invertase Pin-like site-specific DNA recombinase